MFALALCSLKSRAKQMLLAGLILMGSFLFLTGERLVFVESPKDLWIKGSGEGRGRAELFILQNMEGVEQARPCAEGSQSFIRVTVGKGVDKGKLSEQIERKLGVEVVKKGKNAEQHSTRSTFFGLFLALCGGNLAFIWICVHLRRDLSIMKSIGGNILQLVLFSVCHTLIVAIAAWVASSCLALVGGVFYGNFISLWNIWMLLGTTVLGVVIPLIFCLKAKEFGSEGASV